MIYLTKFTTTNESVPGPALLTSFQRFMNGLSPVSRPTILRAMVVLPEGVGKGKKNAADGSSMDILAPCTGHEEYSV